MKFVKRLREGRGSDVRSNPAPHTCRYFSRSFHMLPVEIRRLNNPREFAEQVERDPQRIRPEFLACVLAVGCAIVFRGGQMYVADYPGAKTQISGVTLWRIRCTSSNRHPGVISTND